MTQLISYDQRLIKANETQKKGSVTALSSRWYPGYHLAPLTGWMNDPNGVIFFKGEYHVFYQYYPFAPVWGPMHWGHAKSSDLIHWETLPIALAPGDAYDKDGCFSGCAIDDNGTLTLIYTGHIITNKPHEPETIRQVQCIATSQDGIHFEKHGIVLSEPPEKVICHFRDPRVWQEKDHWFLIIGYRTDDDHHQGTGHVALYSSKNLRDWSFSGTLLSDDSRLPAGMRSYMWECPDFFPLNGHHILMFSPQGLEPQGYQNRNLYQNGYIVGSWVENQFKPQTFFTELDYGHDFYAAQRFEDGKDRQILIAWFDMWESNKPSQRDGWAGSMTLPRELQLVDNHILMTPVKEIENLRISEKTHAITTLNNEKHHFRLNSPLQEIELIIDLRKSNAAQAGLALRTNNQGQETVIYIDQSQKRIVLDRNRSGQNLQGIRSCPLPETNKLTLRIFLDRSSVEIFVGDDTYSGRYTISSRIFPEKDSMGASLFAIEGKMIIDSFKSWVLQDANALYYHP
ncbi:MAG: sucrose-6-phosphate hydrolase [Zymomonas mobilis subsp. pomaceae]|uniref:Sucrose-6-phosphate hydrolase n=1 Tax=Zymomonas mobilis subsp. pomaceae (strain ATCC 29192 / DSM 22645 / JCM 10191 / CCUG 17912 / NBRC 13757 / NCIMB 11200 / NRRL B-4491 / Barker I) TaxID=579138 RepID=F8EUL3_ZYMMT|nr:sucrose-6-phosphate hydrolase [Zymomonas mobilis]AEI37229.1 sucrose-6-phosphate hydrolase [Zymomonas mobilis subsp. pomaceae ATCC 29192]MDX5948599.1 sucrose-6-phosphate hydrolase [Zymomonas mobilis subsp. pomaceae]GEB88405.1 invertase [Zymomonas mobilis subsp. pomaceae]